MRVKRLIQSLGCKRILRRKVKREVTAEALMDMNTKQTCGPVENGLVFNLSGEGGTSF